jgi:hypothetical protein
LKSLIHQIPLVPVTQEILVLCQTIQFFSTACYDLAVKIFWTLATELPVCVFEDQVAEFVVIYKVD